MARYGVAYSEIANGYELTVIAACVIGGVSIGGGVGTVPGTLLGALFLGIVMTALPVMQISPFWQMAISGAVILGGRRHQCARRAAAGQAHPARGAAPGRRVPA